MKTETAEKPARKGRFAKKVTKEPERTGPIALIQTVLKYVGVAIEGNGPSMIYDAIPIKSVIDIYKKYIKKSLLASKKSLDPIYDLMIKSHWTQDGRMAIPCRNIKYGMVSCLDLFGKVGITKVKFRKIIYVKGLEEADMIPVECNIKDLDLRLDSGKNKMGNAIGLVRPEILKWRAYFMVGYPPEMFSDDSIFNLINTVGIHNGLMALRTERTCDSHGSFKVITCPLPARMKNIKSITMKEMQDVLTKKLKEKFGIYKQGDEWVV